MVRSRRRGNACNLLTCTMGTTSKRPLEKEQVIFKILRKSVIRSNPLETETLIQAYGLHLAHARIQLHQPIPRCPGIRQEAGRERSPDPETAEPDRHERALHLAYLVAQITQRDDAGRAAALVSDEQTSCRRPVFAWKFAELLFER